VEDDDGIRRLAARTLRDHGYEVIEATNGAEALAAWEQHGARVDVLLTDVVMPGMTGVELVERIAARGDATRVVLMSGYADPESVGRVQSPGAVGFVEKPFTQAALLRAVRSALDGWD
jgi:CheY-like chemotaxis protein